MKPELSHVPGRSTAAPSSAAARIEVRTRLVDRLQQQIIDAEVRASRREILADLRNRFR